MFTDWVGEDNKQLLYEIIAYSCYQGYPIQTLFCLIGIGRNGKSTFLKILKNFIGQDNCCSTELDLIAGEHSSRFETFKMYKKLLCFMGETNFGILTKSSMIKKLTGGDMIGYEMKNKKPFDDYNYAKLIIASNSLPTTEDTSDGFYRRWVIIDFPNQFQEGKDITEDIPKSEYENLCKKCIEILPNLIKTGYFTNNQDSSARKEKYIMASNPFPKYVKEFLTKTDDQEDAIRFSELYNAYAQYLKHNKRRIVSRKEFSQTLDIEGIEVRKTSKKIGESYVSDRWIECYKFNDSCDSFTIFPTQQNMIHKAIGKVSTQGTKVTNQEIILEKVVSNQEIDILSPEEVVINKCKLSPQGWQVTEDFEKTVEVMKQKMLVFEVAPNKIKLLE